MKIKILDYKEINYILKKVLNELNENGIEIKSIEELKEELEKKNGIIYYFWDYNEENQ